jgi:hypothetical protein
VYMKFKDDVLNQPAARNLGEANTRELLESTLTFRQCFRELLAAG